MKQSIQDVFAYIFIAVIICFTLKPEIKNFIKMCKKNHKELKYIYNKFKTNSLKSILKFIISIIINLIYQFLRKILTEIISNYKAKEITESDLLRIKHLILKMDSRNFEIFCAKLFELQGYKSNITPSTRDGGKDVVLTKSYEKIYVECKHYKINKPVSRDAAMKLVGSMRWGNVQRGIIITTGSFTKDCISYCEDMNIQTINLEAIMNLVKKINNCNIVSIIENIEVN